MIKGERIVSLVGQSGSGKTTQMRELVQTPGFRISPNITTRACRSTDLPNEYSYLSPVEYAKLLRSGRLLWNASVGAASYSKDICDVIEALTDPDHIYVHALVPEKAAELVRRYGSTAVKTAFLPSPGDHELLDRMTQRGDSIDDAAARLTKEAYDDWTTQSLAISGIHVVTAQSVAERHEELLHFAQS